MNKKLLVWSAIIVACIFAAPILIGNITNDEMTLAESMENTKQEHDKIDQFLTKTNQQFHTKYGGEASVGFTLEKRIANVQVENQQLADKHGKEMKSLIYDIANEIRLDNIHAQVKVMNYPDEDISEEDQALRELFDEVSETTIEIIQQNGLEVGGIQISPKDSYYYVEITLPFKEKLNENNMVELEKQIKNAISIKTNEDIDVTIKKKTKNQVRDEKWGPIFKAIREETNKKFEEYRGFASSFYPEPLKIIIKTDLRESNWWRNTDKKVEEIMEYVEAIIELKREELGVEEIPFKIIVKGENNEQLK